MTDAAKERDQALAGFAAKTLELPAVLEVLAGLAPSSLGRRATLELAPLPTDEVAAAYRRLEELQMLARAKDEPSLGGVTTRIE